MFLYIVKINKRNGKIEIMNDDSSLLLNTLENIRKKIDFAKNYEYLCKKLKDGLNYFDYFDENIFVLKSDKVIYIIYPQDKTIHYYAISYGNKTIIVPLPSDIDIRLLNTKGTFL